jgi:glycosyltransferase involved in cell wall biosynthesis
MEFTREKPANGSDRSEKVVGASGREGGRLYFDITCLLIFAPHHRRLSGVQRVEIELIRETVNSRGASACRLIGLHPDSGVATAYASDFFAGDYVYDRAAFCDHFGLSLRGVEAAVEPGRGKARRRRFRHRLKSALKRIRSALASAIAARFAVARGAARAAAAPGEPQPSSSSSPAEAAARLVAGDVILASGATWNLPRHAEFLAQCARDGVRVVQFVHDLIPLVAPEHVDGDLSRDFSQWLEAAARTASDFIANSRSTQADLLRFLTLAKLAPKPCSVLPLAHEFRARDDAGPPSPAIHFINDKYRSADWGARRVFNAARLPFVLCVGTVETRKNVWMLARVWIALAGELTDAPRLIFAGAKGWSADDLDELMRATGNAGGMIRFVESPSDAELAFLYANCLFSVFVSYYEGWGLPIGESLWFGKPALASAAGAMPEVGQDMVDYADPHSFADIKDKALRLISDDAYRDSRAAAIKHESLRRWRDVADDLWSILAHAPTPARRGPA